MSDVQTEISKLSFEDAMQELEQIVRQLETGQSDLDKSIQSYERGMALKQYCESKLKEAQAKIEKITIGQDGAVKKEPFQAEG